MPFERRSAEPARLTFDRCCLDLDSSRLYLQHCLGRTVAELDTSATSELDHDGTAWVDALMPSSQDLQPFEAEVLERSQTLKLRSLSKTALRKDHMRFLHSLGFRIISEAFSRVPAIQTLVLFVSVMASDGATGRNVRQLRYSVRVPRAGWSELNFKELEHLDPVSCLGTFDMLRNMTKTGIFKPVSPHLRSADSLPENHL